MQIDETILSLPPYISTSWKNVISLSVNNQGDKPYLVIELSNGSRVEVPALDNAVIDTVFAAHKRYLSERSEKPKQESVKNSFSSFFGEGSGFAMPMLDFGKLEGITQMFGHNQENANADPLPPEILEKIAMVTKNLGNLDDNSLPKAEPHCNCPFCQVARAMHGDAAEESSEEEVVSDEDLTFQDWKIEQTSPQLYDVRNPLNKDEHYNVFLGSPVGCTCGQKDCEHIKAVLRS